MLSHFGPVRLFATPWTVARQAALSIGILQPRILQWVAMPFLQGIFPTQGSNVRLLCLLHWQHLPLVPPGKPKRVPELIQQAWLDCGALRQEIALSTLSSHLTCCQGTASITPLYR